MHYLLYLFKAKVLIYHCMYWYRICEFVVLQRIYYILACRPYIHMLLFGSSAIYIKNNPQFKGLNVTLWEFFVSEIFYCRWNAFKAINFNWAVNTTGFAKTFRKCIVDDTYFERQFIIVCDRDIYCWLTSPAELVYWQINMLVYQYI